MIDEIDMQLDPITEQLKDSIDATVLSASLLNDALESVSNYESEVNEYHINKIAFDVYLEDRDALQASEVSILENIINQCPSSGGKAVYEARALYNRYVNDSIVFEDDSLCTSSLRTMGTITNVIKTETEYCRIYPNPANDYLNVEYLLSAQEKHLRFVLSDISGRIVHEQTLQSVTGRFSIDVSDVRKGIYIYYMQSGKESKFHQKVVIVR